MKITSLTLSLILLHFSLAHPSIFAPNHASLQKRCPPFDPAGVKNIGNNAGTQFIGGQCLSNTDCASNCCALPCGICSGPGASFQAGKQGCGFGGGNNAAAGNNAGSNGAVGNQGDAGSRQDTNVGNNNADGKSCNSA